MSDPLILLPGMMCDARLFAPQIGALRPGVHVPAIVGADSIKVLAANVLAQAPDTFALAGLSMGGIVAMEVLRQAPHRVRRVALLDTTPLAERAQMRHRRARQMERVRAGGLAMVMRDEMKPNYLVDGPKRREILDLCMDMAMSLGPQVFLDQSVALRDRVDQSTTLRAFGGPALVLCGECDTLCPPERHVLMQRLMAHATLKIVKGAGHLPTLEQPERVTAALVDWLEEEAP